MNILAIDPATNTGWATNRNRGTFDLSVRRDESGGMRLVRLRGKLREMHLAEKFDLVVFEAQRGGNPKFLGSLVVQAEIQATIKLWCEDSALQYRGYSPSEIKKHATGKGNSNKEKMKAAWEVKWGNQIPVESVDDNAIDAMWLLDLAQREYKS